MATTVLPNYRHRTGTHPESTALSNYLRFFGLNFSEAFLFGLGRGLNFIYWQGRKMAAPLIRGRIKPDGVVKNVASLLGSRCEIVAIPTLEVAQSYVRHELSEGHPVLVKAALEDAGLPAGALESNYLVIVGVGDRDFVALAEPDGDEPTLQSLPVLFSQWQKNGTPQFVAFSPNIVPNDMGHTLRTTLRQHASEMLDPPVAYLGVRGIEHFASNVVLWPDRLRDVNMAASVFVQSWTHPYAGGDGYRGLYRHFLIEAFEFIPSSLIEDAVRTLGRAMVYWKGVTASLREVADGRGGMDSFLREASRLLWEVARLESEVMRTLAEV